MPGTLITQALTSNTTPAPYVASASNEYNPAWHAFDKSAATAWLPAVAAPTPGAPHWLQIDLGSAETATTYTITPPGTLDRAPVDWTVQGSTNGTSWTVLDTRSGVAWPSTAAQTFTVTTPSAYRYYRLHITANNGSGLYVQVAEWDLLGSAAEPSVTLDGTAPAVTGAFDVTATTPPVDVALAGAAPAVTGSFALSQAGVGTVDLAGTAPGVFGDFSLAVSSDIAFETATESVDRSHGMTLVTEWTVSVEPPIAAAPRQQAHDYATAVSLPNPTLVEGRPT